MIPYMMEWYGRKRSFPTGYVSNMVSDVSIFDILFLLTFFHIIILSFETSRISNETKFHISISRFVKW
jgi:hypothetical protein